jgi:hypothetical protein
MRYEFTVQNSDESIAAVQSLVLPVVKQAPILTRLPRLRA